MIDKNPFKVTVRVDDCYSTSGWNVYPANIIELNEWCVEAVGPKGLCWGLVFRAGQPIAVYEFRDEADMMLFRMANSR